MGRLKHLDVLRGMAIALMVLNHAGHYLMVSPVSLPVYFSVYLTVALAGPLFLFVSGYCLFLVYGRRPGFKHFLKRGLWLIACGLLINLFFYYDEPIYRGRILLTLGLGAIAVYPFLKLLERPKIAGWLFLLSLIGIFISPAVWSWIWPAAEPAIWQPLKELFASEFSFYPWFFILLSGAVSAKLISGLKKDFLPAAYRRLIIAGSAMMMLWFAGSIYCGRPMLWVFDYDANINGYWLPSALTWLWVLGGVIFWWGIFGLKDSEFPAATKQMESSFFNRIYSLKTGFLAVLGRQALLAYFLQFFLIITIGQKLLKISVTGFLCYLFASLIIILILWFSVICKTRAASMASSPAKPTGRIS